MTVEALVSGDPWDVRKVLAHGVAAYGIVKIRV